MPGGWQEPLHILQPSQNNKYGPVHGAPYVNDPDAFKKLQGVPGGWTKPFKILEPGEGDKYAPVHDAPYVNDPKAFKPLQGVPGGWQEPFHILGPGAGDHFAPVHDNPYVSEPNAFHPLGWQKPFKPLHQIPGGWTTPFKPLQVSKPIDENPPVSTGVCIAAKVGSQQYNTLLSNANLIITNENQCNVVKDCAAGSYNVIYAPTAWWKAHQPELPYLYAPCGGN